MKYITSIVISLLVFTIFTIFMLIISLNNRIQKETPEVSAPIKISCRGTTHHIFYATSVGHVKGTNIIEYKDNTERLHWLTGAFCHVEFAKPKKE